MDYGQTVKDFRHERLGKPLETRVWDSRHANADNDTRKQALRLAVDLIQDTIKCWDTYENGTISKPDLDYNVSIIALYKMLECHGHFDRFNLEKKEFDRMLMEPDYYLNSLRQSQNKVGISKAEFDSVTRWTMLLRSVNQPDLIEEG